jgi:hypothetical protein
VLSFAFFSHLFKSASQKQNSGQAPVQTFHQSLLFIQRFSFFDNIFLNIQNGIALSPFAASPPFRCGFIIGFPLAGRVFF